MRWTQYLKELWNFCLWGHHGASGLSCSSLVSINSADRHRIAFMEWDRATRMMLTLWFWVILTHWDTGWIQDSELPTTHNWTLSLSCMCGLLHTRSPIIVPLRCYLRATGPKGADVTHLVQLPLTPHCWHSGQLPHLSAGSAPHAIQSLGVALPMSSKPF